MGLQFAISFLSPFLYMTDIIPVLEHPWCQAFYRSHKHLREQELVSLKTVLKILLLCHHYLEIYYLFKNLQILQCHLKNFSLTKVKLFIRYVLFFKNFAKKFNSDSFGSCVWCKVFHINFFADLKCQQGCQNVLIDYHQYKFRYCLILDIFSFKYFEKIFRAFFALKLPSDGSKKFCTFSLFVF